MKLYDKIVAKDKNAVNDFNNIVYVQQPRMILLLQMVLMQYSQGTHQEVRNLEAIEAVESLEEVHGGCWMSSSDEITIVFHLPVLKDSVKCYFFLNNSYKKNYSLQLWFMLFLLPLLRVSSPFTILACAIKLIKFVIIVYEYQRNKNFFLYLILITCMYPVHPHAFPCQK